EQSVRGIARVDALADHGLDLPVRLGNRRAIGLGVDGEGPAEVAKCNFSGLIGESFGKRCRFFGPKPCASSHGRRSPLFHGADCRRQYSSDWQFGRVRAHLARTMMAAHVSAPSMMWASKRSVPP